MNEIVIDEKPEAGTLFWNKGGTAPIYYRIDAAVPSYVDRAAGFIDGVACVQSRYAPLVEAAQMVDKKESHFFKFVREALAKLS